MTEYKTKKNDYNLGLNLTTSFFIGDINNFIANQVIQVYSSNQNVILDIGNNNTGKNIIEYVCSDYT